MNGVKTRTSKRENRCTDVHVFALLLIGVLVFHIGIVALYKTVQQQCWFKGNGSDYCYTARWLGNVLH